MTHSRLSLFPLVALALCLTACDKAPTATPTTEKAVATPAAAAADLPKPDYAAIARKLVEQCAGVKEGELVLVQGGAGQTELLEAVTLEAAKKGASPLATYASDKLDRQLDASVPEQYDARLDPFWMKALHPNLNVHFILPYDLDDWSSQVSVARTVARFRRNVEQSQAYYKGKTRLIELNNGLAPNLRNAKRRGIPVEQLAKLFWDGVNIDYAALQANCDALQQTLRTGKEVHVTHSNGTDLKFSIEKQPIFTSDGVISEADAKRGGLAATIYLPAGEVYLPVVLNSATGKLVSERVIHDGKEYRGLTLTFAAGKLTGMSAASGNIATLQAHFDASDKAKVFLSGLDIGTNPNIKVSSFDPVGAFMEAGTLTFAVGHNIWVGGNHVSSFDLAPRLVGGTVKLDGKVIVENGVLKP